MPPPVITTVPLAGWVTDAIEIGPPSTSVSLASTSIAVAAASSVTVAESSTATGVSSTQVDGDRDGGGGAAVERVGEGVGLVPGGLLQ